MRSGRVLILALIAAMAFLLIADPASFRKMVSDQGARPAPTPKPYAVFIDGQDSGIWAINRQGRFLVPLEEIMAALEGSVELDETTGEMTAIMGPRRAILTPDSEEAPVMDDIVMVNMPFLGRLGLSARIDKAKGRLILERKVASGAAFEPLPVPDIPIPGKYSGPLPEGTIVCTYSAGQRDLRIFDSQGHDWILTTEVSFQQRPSISNDGRKIAYESYRDGNWEIYLIDRDTNYQIRLTNTPSVDDLYPEISPAGKSVVYISGKKIMIIDLDAETVDTLVALPAVPKQLDFSPNGLKLVFIMDGQLCLLDIATRQYKTIGKHKAACPTVSPDGTSVAFLSPVDDTPQIFIIGIDGSNERQLTNVNLDKDGLDYSPSGKFLVFSGGPKFAPPRLYIVNSSDGLGLEKIVDVEGRWTDPHWFGKPRMSTEPSPSPSPKPTPRPTASPSPKPSTGP